ncbi:MAG: AI-2E family transporter, partial [Terriglobia bacterium]
VPALSLAGAFTAQTVQTVQRLRQQGREERMPAVAWLTEHLPLERVSAWLAEHANVQEEDLQALVMKNAERIASFVAGQTGRLARNVLFFFFDLFVMLFASFYLFRDGPVLLTRLRRALPLTPAQRDQLLATAHDVLYATVYSSFVVAAVQGLLGGLAFWVLGIGAALFWGVVMGFLSLLPALGAWLIWVPAAGYLLLEGQIVRAVALLVVGTLIIGLVDNFLRPLLISGHTQLNGLLVFISVLGGLAVFGLLGLVLGPMLVAVGMAVVEAYTAEELPPTEAPAGGG